MESFSALLVLCVGMHRSPVSSPHKDQWRGALMFSLICAWTNGWVNNRDAGNLRRHHAHYVVTVISTSDTCYIYHTSYSYHIDKGNLRIQKHCCWMFCVISNSSSWKTWSLLIMDWGECRDGSVSQLLASSQISFRGVVNPLITLWWCICWIYCVRN